MASDKFFVSNFSDYHLDFFLSMLFFIYLQIKVSVEDKRFFMRQSLLIE